MLGAGGKKGINENVRIICLSNYQIERGGKKKKKKKKWKNDLSIVYRLFSFVIKCKRAPRILRSTIIIAAVQFPGQAQEKKNVFNEPSGKIMVFNPRSIQVAWEVHFVVLLIFA